MMMMILVVASVCLFFLSKGKGYSPRAWTLGGGIIGIIILALLPDAKPLMGKQSPENEKRTKVGNRVGCVLSVFTVLGILLYTAVVWSIFARAGSAY